MSLILALSVLLQAQPAETTLLKIEETLEKAKTVRIAYKVELRLTNTKVNLDKSDEYSGALLLKEGNKAFFSYLPVPRTEKTDILFNSDGKKVSSLFKAGAATETNAPSTLGSCLAVGFARAGTRGILHWLRGAPPPPEDADMRKILEVSELKTVDDTSISYKVAFTTQKQTYDVVLTYDPKTHRPLKRILSSASGASSARFVETYGEVDVDGDLPDDQLKLPARK